MGWGKKLHWHYMVVREQLKGFDFPLSTRGLALDLTPTDILPVPYFIFDVFPLGWLVSLSLLISTTEAQNVIPKVGCSSQLPATPVPGNSMPLLPCMGTYSMWCAY